MIRKVAASLAIAALFSLIVAPSVLACRCAKPADPKDALSKATAVFVGKVVSVEMDDSTGEKVVTLEVSRSWKGLDAAKVTVKTAGSSAACGYFFEKDKEYFIYAFGEGDRGLHTNTCTRTCNKADAAEDIKALGEGNAIGAAE